MEDDYINSMIAIQEDFDASQVAYSSGWDDATINCLYDAKTKLATLIKRMRNAE